MADRPEMFGPTRGFSGMADLMEPYKMLWGRPDIWLGAESNRLVDYIFGWKFEYITLSAKRQMIQHVCDTASLFEKINFYQIV